VLLKEQVVSAVDLSVVSHVVLRRWKFSCVYCRKANYWRHFITV